jgi:hypothetical protein
MSHPYAARPIGASVVWLTPPEIIEALGPFDLDPCAAPSPRPWPTAARHIELPDDGLAADWRGRVWCNPPFGSHTGQWLRRMALHGNGIALAFARTDTAMFQAWVWPQASAVLFLAKRPHFHTPDGKRAAGNSGGPIVLIGYGEENAESLRNSGLSGACMRVLPSLPASSPLFGAAE